MHPGRDLAARYPGDQQADQAITARRVRDRVGADYELSARVAEQHVLAWLVAQRRPGRAQQQLGDHRGPPPLGRHRELGVFGYHRASPRSPRAASASSSRWKYTSPA